MAHKASLSSAASSIFGAVSTVAETSGNLVTDIASAAEMFSSMINHQKKLQKDRYKIREKNYRSELIDEYNEKITQRTIELSKKFEENPEFQKLYLENQKKLEAIFDDE